jgi:acyl-CoA synthetase (AMP-forming)/AMP-acid ligase II
LVTAGSTGSPKAVRLEVSRLLYAAQAVAAHHALTMRDRGFSPAPLFRVNGQVAGLLAQLLSGGTILLDHRFHAAEFAHIVRDTEPTWINAVPVMLAALAADRRFSLPPSVRFVRSSSAPLPHAVRRQFEARVGPLVLETYELTEAAGQVAANPLSPRLRRGGSVGRPVATRIRIVDDVGCDLKPYQEGAVVVAGPQVVTRYLSATGDLSGPDAAWLTTGDRGYRDTEGFLYVVGRAEEVGQASAAGSSHFEQRERRERPLQALG